VHIVSDFRQIEIQTAQLLLPDPSPFEVEIGTGNSKKYKSQAGTQIPAELIQAGGETLRLRSRNSILFGIRKNAVHKYNLTQRLLEK
jgi:hypothetical protein